MKSAIRSFLIAALLLSIACATRRPGAFQVLPGTPEYSLRSPDRRDTPFPQILGRHTNLGFGWVDLRPRMQLRIENAYYREGMPKRGLNGFLGTEVARYDVQPNGRLRQAAVETQLRERPRDQPPVQALIARSQRRYRHHRFFNAVIFKRQGDSRGSVLLGAKSAKELEKLAKQLLDDPDLACGTNSPHCSVFPVACTVSVEMEIVVNGAPRVVSWGTLLANVTPGATHLALLRHHQGRLTPVQIDPADPNARRLPLLPGDQITWN